MVKRERNEGCSGRLDDGRDGVSSQGNGAASAWGSASVGAGAEVVLSALVHRAPIYAGAGVRGFAAGETGCLRTERAQLRLGERLPAELPQKAKNTGDNECVFDDTHSCQPPAHSSQVKVRRERLEISAVKGVVKGARHVAARQISIPLRLLKDRQPRSLKLLALHMPSPNKRGRPGSLVWTARRFMASKREAGEIVPLAWG